MKSKKITSLKQAREIIQCSGILEVGERDHTVNSDFIKWYEGDEYVDLGYLYRDIKSRRIYTMVDPVPSNLRAIGKVFKYEIACNFYGGFRYADTTILWLKEAVNE